MSKRPRATASTDPLFLALRFRARVFQHFAETAKSRAEQGRWKRDAELLDAAATRLLFFALEREHALPLGAIMPDPKAALLAAQDQLHQLRWRPMTDALPDEGQVIVHWADGSDDCIGKNEYLDILGLGEPVAQGWMPLPPWRTPSQ